MTKLTKPNKGDGSVDEMDLLSKYSDLKKRMSVMERDMLRNQAALKEIEEIYNYSPCGYHTLDQNGVITRINDTELGWLGYSREELIYNKKITDILSIKDREFFSKDLSLLEHGGCSKNSYLFLKKDNSQLLLCTETSSVCDDKGNLKFYRATTFLSPATNGNSERIYDSRKELSKKNIALHKENEEMLLLNDAKDRFIGIAYHDLQSPLAVVMLLSKILLGNDLPDSKEKIRETYTTIYDASLQMNDLIRNYLNVNRIEKGLIEPKLVPLDIVKITKNIISRYGDLAQRKNITVLFTGSLKKVILMDAECYSQIIENLLSNAIKYTPRGKTVFVKIVTKSDEVIVEIEDEGVGIKESEIPLLYGKFQQLSSKPTEGELSTGLGLSIVKFLVDQLKGTISVKSKLGTGTRFRVSFRNISKIPGKKKQVKTKG